MKLILISWAALIPLLFILIYFTAKKLLIVIGIIGLERQIIVTPNNYNDLYLKEVGTDYRVPRGQVPYFTYEISNMEIGQKERKYVGSTKSGIRLPFMKLSLQNKTFIEGSTYESWGETKVTITNRIIRLVSHGDTPIKREIKIIDIEQMKYVGNSKTIQISSRGWAWPIRVSFQTKREAIEFQNGVWTILYRFGTLKRQTKIFVKDIYE